MIEITWKGLALTCELEYEPADPSVGYMTEQFGLCGVVTDSGDDILEDLTDGAQDEILDLAIAAVKEDREERQLQASITNAESREHALAERQMRRMGV